MLPTGVPNLDLILGGGIPQGDVLLVVGPAGSGKTTLAFQTAFHTARAGQSVLYVATVSEPPTRLIRHVRSFSFYDESLIGKRLFLLGIYPLVKQGLANVADALTGAVREHQATLVIVDGLMTIRDLHPQTTELRTFIYELGATTATLGATTILTSSGTERLATQPLPEYTMADGILELGRSQIGTRSQRTISVAKMRGLAPLLGQHALRLDATGLTVFPRLESIFERRDIGLSAERMPFGLAELDVMMAGGCLANSVTLLAGAIRAGQVEIVRRAPPRTPRRRRGPQARGALERLKAHRLVLDSIADLEPAIIEEERRRGYMAALTSTFRSLGATTLVTKEIAQVVGPELDFSDTPLAVLAENLILLRYVEFRGELYRILSVIKMRDSDHDRSIRQYTITLQGLNVLARMESGEGVLTGIARLPSDLHVKRGAAGAYGGGTPG